MTKIPLKAITITYTKTVTVTPTSQMFEDWECPPDQEAFESLVLGEFFDDILEDMRGGTPIHDTDVQQFEDVEVEWWDLDEDEEERYDRDFNTEGMGDMIGPPDRTAIRKEVDDYFEVIKND